MNFQLENQQYFYELAGSQDSQAMLRLFSQAHIGAHIAKRPIHTEAALFDELRRMDLRFKQQEAIFWLLQNKHKPQFDACISLQKINALTQSARIVWQLEQQLIATEVLADMLAPIVDFATHALGLHRIELYLLTEQYHQAAVNAGFVREGVLPRQLELNGVWQDLTLYAKLLEV